MSAPRSAAQREPLTRLFARVPPAERGRGHRSAMSLPVPTKKREDPSIFAFVFQKNLNAETAAEKPAAFRARTADSSARKPAVRKASPGLSREDTLPLRRR